jgi:hypothetical protein
MGKEHCAVEEQQATIAQLKRDFAEQRKQVETLKAIFPRRDALVPNMGLGSKKR